MGIADKDDKLTAINQFGPYTETFIVSEIMASEIEFRTERCQQRFAKHFARLMLGGINNVEFDEAIRTDLLFGETRHRGTVL